MEIISLLMNFVKSRKKKSNDLDKSNSLNKLNRPVNDLLPIDPKLLNRKSSISRCSPSCSCSSTLTSRTHRFSKDRTSRKSSSIGSRFKNFRKSFYVSAKNNFTFDQIIFDDYTGEIVEICGKNKSVKMINKVNPIPSSNPIKFNN